MSLLCWWQPGNVTLDWVVWFDWCMRNFLRPIVLSSAFGPGGSAGPYNTFHCRVYTTGVVRRYGGIAVGELFEMSHQFAWDIRIYCICRACVVTVLRARDLKSADIGGKSDPHCVLELVNERFQTHTQYKTLSPDWGKVFVLSVCTLHFSKLHSICSVIALKGRQYRSSNGTVFRFYSAHRFSFLVRCGKRN